MIAGSSIQIVMSIFIFLVVFNFFPASLAYVSQHPERHRLAALNILSLFSFALWLVLMAWAVGGKRDDSAINRFMADAGKRRLVMFGAVAVAAFSFGSTLGGLHIV